MQKGIVKFFNNKKGYGFIVDEATGTEVFVHHSGLINRVRDQQKVEFETTEDQKGVKAVNVKIISN